MSKWNSMVLGVTQLMGFVHYFRVEDVELGQYVLDWEATSTSQILYKTHQLRNTYDS